MRLEGKTALITGASRNIGRQIALTFAREGADLILNTRKSREELDSISAQCRDLGAETFVAMGDVSDPDSVEKIVSDGIESMGKIDILVSNVAIRPHKPILEISNDEWHHIFSVNLHAAFYLIKAVLPFMIERRSGSIVAMGGQSAITGRPKTAAVTAAKTGLLGLIRAVAAEMATYDVRANMVNPGRTDTERLHPEWYSWTATDKKGGAELIKSIPLGRTGTVDDIANACLFLASDEAGYITGEQLNVVGGRYMV